MKEEIKIELMKIAAGLTHDAVDHMKQGISAGKKTDINEIFASCLAGVKEQFDKLD